MSAAWHKPSPEEVQIALGSLADASLRQLFFNELENPEWLEPLAEQKVFDADPEAWIDAQGVARAKPWPEGDYLARIAALRPTLVTNLLLAHADSKNPWVQRVGFEAALSLPPLEAARLVPQVAKAISSGTGWVDASRILALAERLVQAYPKQARALVTAAFEPRPGQPEVTMLGERMRTVASVEGYWYRESVPRLAQLLAALGQPGLRLAVGWLIKAVEIPAGEGSPDAYDSSHIWRPSIAPHAQNSGMYDIADALIDLTSQLAQALVADVSLATVVEFLQGFDRMLLSRIAVETVAQAVSSQPDHQNLAIAAAMLMDSSMLDERSRPEYLRLARVTLPHLTDEALTSWVTWVSSDNWQGSDEELRRVAAWGRDESLTDEDLDAEVSARRRRMRLKLLQPLQDVLPDSLTSDLGTLRDEFGAIEHPEFSSFTTSFVGPTSPLDAAGLDTMSPSALLDFLQTWQPDPADRWGPSREGLARELEQLAARKPEVIEGIAGEITDLGRSYVRAVVGGWATAVESGYSPAEGAWELLEELAVLPDAGEEVSARFEEDDPAWRWAQRRVADLAISYLRARGTELSAASARRIWGILQPLLGHADPTGEHEDRFGGDNMDPLTLSLNSVRPTALRASLKLLGALKRREGAAETAIRTEILGVLDQHVGPSQDPSLAVAAALGEGLGILWDVDPEWVQARSDTLFSVLAEEPTLRAHSDVVVSVALKFYRTSRAFLEMMRPALLQVLTAGYVDVPHIEGWRADSTTLQAAALHVVRGYVFGLLEEHDPLLTALFSPPSSPEAAGHALGTLGWAVMRGSSSEDEAEAAPPEVLERAKRLIESRADVIRSGEASAEELSGFYWWVRAGVYPPSWWLPLLRLANTAETFNPKGMLGEALVWAASQEPTMTIEILDELLPRDVGWQRYDLLQHAPRIIASALSSDEPAAIERARELLDRLGREGHLALLAEVDDLVELPDSASQRADLSQTNDGGQHG